MVKKFQQYHDRIVPFLILIGISFMLFYHAVDMLDLHEDSVYAFNSFFSGWDNYLNFKVAWRGRLFANAFAAAITNLSCFILEKKDVLLINTPLELSVALWTTMWFFATGLLFIFVARFQSLFYIFGSYAAIAFGYMPRSLGANRIYPWDMPAFFVYALFLILYVRKEYKWILIFLPLAVGFKETALLLSIGFLFADLPLSTRLKMMIGSIALGVSVKLLVDLFVQVPVPFLTMESGETLGNSYLSGNLTVLLSLHPLLVNAGTLLAFFLLPNYDKAMSGLKIIAFLFIVNIFLFGIITEYRIFFELIPFSLYGLERAAYGTNSLSKSLQQAKIS